MGIDIGEPTKLVNGSRRLICLLGQMKLAEQKFQQTLTLQSESSTPEYQQAEVFQGAYWTAQHRLAQIQMSQGRFGEAFFNLQSASNSAIYSKGQHSPYFNELGISLAEWYFELGEYEKSARLSRNAFKYFGDNYWDAREHLPQLDAHKENLTLLTGQWAATLSHSQPDYAEELLKLVLVEDDQPLLLEQIKQLLLKLGFANSMEQLESTDRMDLVYAHPPAKVLFEFEPQKLAKMYRYRAIVRTNAGRFDAAHRDYELAIDLCGQSKFPTATERLQILWHQSNTFRKQKRNSDANGVLAEALTIVEKSPEKNSVMHFKLLVALAELEQDASTKRRLIQNAVDTAIKKWAAIFVYLPEDEAFLVSKFIQSNFRKLVSLCDPTSQKQIRELASYAWSTKGATVRLARERNGLIQQEVDLTIKDRFRVSNSAFEKFEPFRFSMYLKFSPTRKPQAEEQHPQNRKEIRQAELGQNLVSRSGELLFPQSKLDELANWLRKDEVIIDFMKSAGPSPHYHAILLRRSDTGKAKPENGKRRPGRND